MATVASKPRTKSYTLAADSAGPFSIGYRLFDTVSVNVYVDDVLQTGWTVQAAFVNGYDDNATVTPPATVLSGSVVRIETWMETGRAADFVPGDPSLTGNLNNDVARAWALLGDHDRELRRSLRGVSDINPAALSKNSILTIDANGKLVPGTGTIALANLPSYASWAVLDAATGLKDGQLVIISNGQLGKEEVVLIKAAGTYSADGVLVRNLTASGLQAVSTRAQYASYTEAKADPRTGFWGAGMVATIAGVNGFLTATSGTGNWGANASGQQWNVVGTDCGFEIFGAVGDGATDDSAAINLAIASALPLHPLTKQYLCNSPINGTNKAGGGIRISGAYWGEGGNGTEIILNTGGVGLDTTGSQYVSLENIVMSPGATTPSTVGWLAARSTTSQYAQFCHAKNVRIEVASNAAANGGKGSVGVYNNSAEIFDLDNCYVLADVPVAGVSYNPFSIASPFVTIDTSIVSASRMTIRGGNTTLTGRNGLGYAGYFNGITTIDVDAYANSQGTTPAQAYYVAGVTNSKIRGEIENFPQVAVLGNGDSNVDIDVAAPISSSAPFTADTGFVGINHMKLRVATTVAVTAAYFIDGAATNQIQNSELIAPNWTPATGATTWNNVANVKTNFSGVEGWADARLGSPAPQLLFGGTSTGITYSWQNLTYTVQRGVIQFSATLLLTSKGTATGSATISGLPKPTRNSSNAYTSFNIAVNGLTGVSGAPYALAGPNVSEITLGQTGTGGGAALTDANFTNASLIVVSGSYEVD